MPAHLAPCGTYGGAQRHNKNGERPCEECMAARRAYMQQYRRTHGEYYTREKKRNSARYRAVWRLKSEYPNRFNELYLEELDR